MAQLTLYFTTLLQSAHWSIADFISINKHYTFYIHVMVTGDENIISQKSLMSAGDEMSVETQENSACVTKLRALEITY